MNIMIFCSNPVNGGTARIFYETVIGIQKKKRNNDSIYPCINEGNKVEIYQKISNLVELSIVSAETVFPELYGGNIVRRVVNTLKRNRKYKTIYRKNINVIIDFLKEKSIDAVIIHNGGYVGDDLCNQVLEASYRYAEHTLCRMYVLHNDMKKNWCAKMRFCNYDRTISKQATEIITVSDYTKNRMLSSSFITHPIDIIYDGINVKKSMSDDEKRKLINTNNKYHNILMIGNFLDNKGQMKFIDSAEILYNSDQNYRFTIIGNVYDDVYYKECCKLISRKGLSSVISIYQGVNNAFEYIDLFDVMVVPSLYDESFGLISVEAMANGVPVVAFACGGIPEVVTNGRNGFVVPVGDSDAMANKIRWLIDHPNERERMGKVSEDDYLKKFSSAAMVKRYMIILNN